MEKEKEAKQKPDFVKWFSELDKNSGKYAGGKGANLSEIYNLKIPVPPGFVVTAQAYDYFLEDSKLKEKIYELLEEIDYQDTKQLDKVTKEIREMIINSKLPKEIEEEILDSYDALDTSKIETGKGLAHDILRTSSEPIFVAVRSSATAEDLAEASFAGQQDSFLNIKGKDQLLEHVKKCFASLFTSRATYYRNKKGFEHKKVSLAVVVQKMVDSDKSGVIFSKDPAHKNDNILMEAVWGLGEGIVSGKITPDRYILSPELEIKEKVIADKKIAITRDSGGGKTTVKLREEKSKHQVLTEYEIKKLGDFALKLEEHYGKPQDIEFAIEGEEIFIVQTRPVTTMEGRIEEVQELKGEVVLTGMGASPGIASGRIKLVEKMEDLDKVKEGDVLVTQMTNPDMVVTMQRSAAIVTDQGGLTAHAAIVSREMGIPCVVGTQEATTKLKEGEVITVNGSTGKIYKGKVAETTHKEVRPVRTETKTKIKVIVDLPSFAERAAKTELTKVGLTRIEGIIAESGKHPEYFLKRNEMKDYEDIIYKGIKKIAEYFEEIWVRTSDIRTDEYQNLEGAPKKKEANPMLGMHGIRYSIKNPEVLKSELRALKRVAEGGTKIGLLLPQVIYVEEVQKVKIALKEIDFNDAKVGVMIETPAAVQLIRDLCEDGLDFISFGTNDLTQYMLAIDRGNEQVQDLYNEMHPAVLYQLSYVIRVCKRYNVETSICGQAGSKKPMAKYLVEKGIDSISVNADVAADIAEYVAELEKELVAGTDKEPRKYKPAQESEKKPEEKKEPKGEGPVTPYVKEIQDFVKPQTVIEEVEETVEKGLEAVEEVVKEVIEDKRGEAPIIPGVERLQEETNEDDKEESQEEKETKDVEEETREEIIDDIEESGVPEEVAEQEEKLDEKEQFDEEPEFKEHPKEEIIEDIEESGVPEKIAEKEEEPDEEEQFDEEPEFKEHPKEEDEKEKSEEDGTKKEDEVLDIF